MTKIIQRIAIRHDAYSLKKLSDMDTWRSYENILNLNDKVTYALSCTGLTFKIYTTCILF